MPNKNVVDWRRRTKLKLIIYKGSKCAICKYDKYQGALEFHHIDPNEKDFSVSRNGVPRAWATLKGEVDKCILVCANCHREIHANLAVIPENSITIKEGDLELLRNGWNPETGRRIVPPKQKKIRWPSESKLRELLRNHSRVDVGEIIGVREDSVRERVKNKYGYPSIEEFIKRNPRKTKIQWPNEEELRDMLSGSSFVQVGKQLGVSDNAVRKHIKSKYGDVKSFLGGSNS